MRHTSLPGLIVVFVLLASCREAGLSRQEQQDYNAFCTLLQGNWKLESKDVYECWDFSAQTAGARVLRVTGGDTVLLETIQLVEAAGGIYYRVLVENQNEGQAIDFELTGIQPHELVFENPDHDFPQRIAYKFAGNDRLVATTSGMVEGKNREVIFSYSRQP